MLGSRVAFMKSKTIFGENLIVHSQRAVPDHLGDNGGAGNGEHMIISSDNRLKRKIQVRDEPVAINEQLDFFGIV